MEDKVQQEKSRPKLLKSKKKLKVTSGTIERYQEKKYLENIAPLVETGYKQLLAAMNRGDMKALEIGLQIANLYKPRTGQVNVVTQIYNKNGNDSSGSDKAQSFESILRRLEAGDNAAAHASAKSTQVIDV